MASFTFFFYYKVFLHKANLRNSNKVDIGVGHQFPKVAAQNNDFRIFKGAEVWG